jgi:predicted DNA-binding transcriptional regulator AlpA
MASMADRIGFAPSTVYGWIADEKMAFPRPLKLTKNIALFLTVAVNAWLAERGLMQAQGAA